MTPPTETEVLRRQSCKSWSWFEETVSDVLEDQANWWPPGTANSIGATYLHVVINADVEINQLMRHLAAWLGTLDTDFDIENAQAHPELTEHLRRVAGRYQRPGHRGAASTVRNDDLLHNAMTRRPS